MTGPLHGSTQRQYLPISIVSAYDAVSFVLFVMYWINERAAQRNPLVSTRLL